MINVMGCDDTDDYVVSDIEGDDVPIDTVIPVPEVDDQLPVLYCTKQGYLKSEPETLRENAVNIMMKQELDKIMMI